MPGPSSVTCRSTQPGRLSRRVRRGGACTRSSIVTVLPAGDARRALESRLSMICSTAPGTASTGPTLPANSTRETSSRANSGCQVRCRSAQTAPRSTAAGMAACSSSRAIASRCPTIRASRSVSVTAAVRLPRARLATSGSRFSRRSRSAASGVFSWCEASPANARWEDSRWASRAAVWLNAAARLRTSGGPFVIVTGVNRPPPSASSRVACSSSRMGRPVQRAKAKPTPATAVSTASPPRASSSHTW